MIKKSQKHLIIVAVNWVVLCLLFKISTDELDLALDNSHNSSGIFIITIFTLISLFVIRILLFFFRKKNLARKTKIKIAIVATLITSSLLYVSFLKKYVSDILINKDIRMQLHLK